MKSSLVVDSDGDFILMGGEEMEAIDLLRQLRTEAASSNNNDDNIVILNSFVLQEESLWTEAVAAEIVTTFQHYSSNNNNNNKPRRWKVGIFREGPANDAFHAIIGAAIETKRFDKLVICTSRGREDDYSRTLSTLFRNISSIQHLQLDGFVISEVTCQVLAQGLILACPAARPNNTNNNEGQGLVVLTHLTFMDCEFGDGRYYVADDFGINPALATLAAGWMGNRTLHSLVINNSQGYNNNTSLDDSELAILIRGLIMHPTLQRLELSCQEFGPEAMEALTRIASTCCRLTHLKLSNNHTGNNGLLDMEHLQSIANPPRLLLSLSPHAAGYSSFGHHHALQVLDLSNNDMTSSQANLLLGTLLSHQHVGRHFRQQLTVVNLFQNRIRDWVELTKNLIALPGEVFSSSAIITRPRPPSSSSSSSSSRLRTLVLDGNLRDIDTCYEEITLISTENAIMNLLQAFPKLGCIGHDCMMMLEKRKEYTGILSSALQLMDLRRCGGEFVVTAQDDDEQQGGEMRIIPLSLWPLVLERPSKDRYLRKVIDGKERQADILFQLLQGPAFVGRSTFY